MRIFSTAPVRVWQHGQMGNVLCTHNQGWQLGSRVRVLCPDIDAKSVRTIAEARQALIYSADDQLGFLQLFNVHKTCAAIRALVTSPLLAGAAADLLGCNNVRLYQVRPNN